MSNLITRFRRILMSDDTQIDVGGEKQDGARIIIVPEQTFIVDAQYHMKQFSCTDMGDLSRYEGLDAEVDVVFDGQLYKMPIKYSDYGGAHLNIGEYNETEFSFVFDNYPCGIDLYGQDGNFYTPESVQHTIEVAVYIVT